MPRMTEQQLRDYNARMFGPVVGSSSGDGFGAATNESKLHQQILDECRRRGWIAIHARMDMPSTLAVGIWDFTILADDGRVFFIECKTRTGKLSTEQHAMIAWAAKLGHRVQVVRSIEQFLEAI